ncbi:CGNR zinc finger domain-containing protein [Streptomyces roseoviridis]|uniref:CGNR zinc finger domain-containing protein n=1 Tax=Streptomyces roseoviridis TaxID=67361 RepID=A0ABV5QXD2_9ACTN
MHPRGGEERARQGAFGERSRHGRPQGERGDLDTGSGGEHLGAQPFREAAGALRPVFAADGVDAAALTLNALLAERTGPLRLTTHGGASPWHPHVDRDDDAPWAEWFLASSCLSLAVLLWDRGRAPGGVCASATCEDVFVPLGGGRERRRYCSRRCATRERVAAHRRAGAAGSAQMSITR